MASALPQPVCVAWTQVMPHGQWEVVMTRKHGFDHNFGGSSARYVHTDPCVYMSGGRMDV